MTDELDVIVIGAGPAGENAAGRCADGGLRVALVERELVGGECSYWGCIPSKTLIRPGDVLAAARRCFAGRAGPDDDDIKGVDDCCVAHDGAVPAEPMLLRRVATGWRSWPG